MDFRLTSGDEEHFFTGDALYRFHPQGFLIVEADGKKTTYAPGGWDRIVEDVSDGPQIFGI